MSERNRAELNELLNKSAKLIRQSQEIQAKLQRTLPASRSLAPSWQIPVTERPERPSSNSCKNS
jgi:hypothetical protein